MNSHDKDQEREIRSALEDLKRGNLLSAQKVLEPAFENGDQRFANQLGWIYRNHAFAGFNLKKASEFYHVSAQNEDSYAQYALGGIYREMGKPAESVSWYERASENGRPECSYLLFQHFKKLENREKAKYFLEKGVKQGHALAIQREAIDSVLGRNGLANIPNGVVSLIRNFIPTVRHARGVFNRLR